MAFGAHFDLIASIPACDRSPRLSHTQTPMVAAYRWRIEMKLKVVVLDLASGFLALALTSMSLLATPALGKGDEPVAFEKLGSYFTTVIRPIINESCMKCHSAEEQKGTSTSSSSRRCRRSPATRTWLKVAEMLDNGEMPPEGRAAAQPERAEAPPRLGRPATSKAEALASAGDPGPVVLRRLSNAEYTYTLRDLTGVDARPGPRVSRPTARRAKASRTPATRW